MRSKVTSNRATSTLPMLMLSKGGMTSGRHHGRVEVAAARDPRGLLEQRDVPREQRQRSFQQRLPAGAAHQDAQALDGVGRPELEALIAQLPGGRVIEADDRIED